MCSRGQWRLCYGMMNGKDLSRLPCDNITFSAVVNKNALPRYWLRPSCKQPGSSAAVEGSSRLPGCSGWGLNKLARYAFPKSFSWALQQ